MYYILYRFPECCCLSSLKPITFALNPCIIELQSFLSVGKRTNIKFKFQTLASKPNLILFCFPTKRDQQKGYFLNKTLLIISGVVHFGCTIFLRTYLERPSGTHSAHCTPLKETCHSLDRHRRRWERVISFVQILTGFPSLKIHHTRVITIDYTSPLSQSARAQVLSVHGKK